MASRDLTTTRAARVDRLVRILCAGPTRRAEVYRTLGIGIRSFYRDLDWIRRHGARVEASGDRYWIRTNPEEVRARLPFPAIRLSFAEVEELARGDGPAARRLAALLVEVASPGERPASRPGRKPRGAMSRA